jgi:CRISPR-associated exonuclease Cas4
MKYSEDEMLRLSGIQHFMFCARQWALIHIEQVWADNKLTAEGSLFHTVVDNPFYRQKNDDKITLRGIKLASETLGLYGIADAIELLPTTVSENSITHPRYTGLWTPHIVEYKHGSPKYNEVDEVQLTAQVICLEEMYNIHITEASLFYFETRRRERVVISPKLRELTLTLAESMHHIFKIGALPKPPQHLKQCRNCSLRDLCLPQLQRCPSVSNYLLNNLYETTT